MKGLGLPMAEAMLLGTPVIATRYSGNVDFMDDSNSLLVDCRLVKLGKTIPPYDADGHWAEPSVEHAVRLLRQVYENQEWAAELGAKARTDLNKRASTQSAGLRMAKRLAEISAERCSSHRQGDSLEAEVLQIRAAARSGAAPENSSRLLELS